MAQYFSVAEIQSKMEHYCAYQERSHFQVEKKLRELGMIPEAIDMIMLHLIEENFLNEERFAKSYVRGKFYQKQWGKIKIKRGLRQHSIHHNLIEKALAEIDFDDYIKTIEVLINKKNKQLLGKNLYQKKQKISCYLMQKGYTYTEFGDLLNDL